MLRSVEVEDTLPNKLSELMEVAHADFKKCREDADYRLDFSAYHVPRSHPINGNGKACLVCMAGATIAKTFGMSKNRFLDPYSFVDKRVSAKLEAISQASFGFVGDAVYELLDAGVLSKEEVPDWTARGEESKDYLSHSPYCAGVDVASFDEKVEDFIAELKKEGL